jgi:peptidyl-prolyl cis-trans isomerase SurA
VKLSPGGLDLYGKCEERSPRTASCWIAACAILAIAVVLLLPAGACSSGQAGPDVLAKVNGRKIMRSEVEKYYHSQTEGAPQSPSEEQAQSLRLSIVHELIDNEILMQRAEKLGLMATDEEVESKLNSVKAPYTKEEFDQRLKERKITLDDFRRDIRRSITIEKVVNKEISSKVNIVDADVTAYYTQHKAEFNLIEPQYHLAQILVTAQPNPQVHNLKNDKAQNEADARKKVQMIMHRLESGEDFAAVAANYSEQPETSANGGDLGFVPESSLKSDRQAAEAISKLKAGQYTPPLPGADANHKLAGFRIIRLISRETAGQREMNDPRVQQVIRTSLRERREQLLRTAYYESMRNEAKVENYLADSILKSSGAQ